MPITIVLYIPYQTCQEQLSLLIIIKRTLYNQHDKILTSI